MDEQVLEEFQSVLEDHVSADLRKLCQHDDLFSILGLQRAEIRHSRFIAWLLDSSQPHQLGDEMFRRLVKLAPGGDALIQGDERDIEVRTEFLNTDIIAFSRRDNVLLVIENKVDTGQHDNQLNRYIDSLNTRFPSYKNRIVAMYLTLHGSEPQADGWNALSYEHFLNELSEAKKSRWTEHKPLSKVQDIIADYQKLIERELISMPNAKITKYVEDLYREHHEAIDLINQYKPKPAEIILNTWKNQLSQFGVTDTSIGVYFRFLTPELDDQLKGLYKFIEGETNWRRGYPYMWEIKIAQGESMHLDLVLQRTTTTTQHAFEKIVQLMNKYPSQQKQINDEKGKLMHLVVPVPGLDRTPMDLWETNDDVLLKNLLEQVVQTARNYF